MRKKKRTFFIIFGAILFLVLIVGLNLMTKKEGSEVTGAIAGYGSIVSKVSATGSLKAKAQVNLQAQVMARVEKLFVSEGDFVKKGDLLCLLDPKLYEAELILAKARFERAQAVFSRQETLYQKALIAQEQFEATKTEYEVSKAQYEQAQDRFSKTKIIAPISGTVVKLNIEEGETVIIGTMNNPGTVMMVIADLSKMLAIVDVDETEVGALKAGLEAKVNIDALPDTVFIGQVSRVGYMPKQSQVSGLEQSTDFEVEIDLLETAPELRPGMSVSCEIITAQKESVLVVPIQAVGRRKVKGKETQTLFVVENGIAKLTPVKTGSTSETEIEILEGIKEGTTVISGPYKVLSKLKDGARVKVQTIDQKRRGP